MSFLHKLREVSFSVLPIFALVLIAHFTLVPLEPDKFYKFLLGTLALVIGLALFLLGTEVGLSPMGEMLGNSVTRRAKLMPILLTGFLIGFMVTVAEPDLQVLAQQVHRVQSEISQTSLLFAIAAGSALCVLLALLRIFFSISLRWILWVAYGILLVLALFSNAAMRPVAFDAGGASTGPMTVPVMMAFSFGIAKGTGRRHSDEDHSFGMVGLMSLGPIFATLLLSLFTAQTDPQNYTDVEAEFPWYLLVKTVIKEVFWSLLPMLLIFIVFCLFFMKIKRQRFERVLIGMTYAFVGLALFLFGVNYAFLNTGKQLGFRLAAEYSPALLVLIGGLIGLVVVLAEPAVWVLGRQIEDASAGSIDPRVLLTALSVGTAIAIAASMLRLILEIDLLYVLLPLYILALIMTLFSDERFVGIAFDSGGVSSGAMASTFAMPFALGVSEALNRSVLHDAFGLIAMIAIAPLITIQTVGLLYQRKRQALSEENLLLADLAAKAQKDEAKKRMEHPPKPSNSPEAEIEALLAEAERLRVEAKRLELRASKLKCEKVQRTASADPNREEVQDGPGQTTE
ncbi:MAG: DUF1538 domain-containing protein [Eubacteriales bacterium]|nr:DUF1538 domain-containing protein [Eubacteriales bacterium]